MKSEMFDSILHFATNIQQAVSKPGTSALRLIESAATRQRQVLLETFETSSNDPLSESVRVSIFSGFLALQPLLILKRLQPADSVHRDQIGQTGHDPESLPR